MTLWRVVFGLAIAALALPALSAAQGLGDIAARAKADREQRSGKAAEPVRSFTNDDLPERDPSEESEDSADSNDDDENPPDEPTSRRERASEGPDEEEVERSRSQVRRLEAMVEELQQRLNPMSTTYIYGGTGGPVGGVQSDEERAVRRQLDAAQQQLERARDSLAETESRGGSGRRSQSESADY